MKHIPLVGHQKIRQRLEKSIQQGRVSRSYLFSGPARVGKFAVAQNLAQKITGEVAEKINPDILVLGSTKDETAKNILKKKIPVEKIRGLQHWLSLSAGEKKYRVAIIDDFDRATKAAQNALLKTLESLPAQCVLILVCHDEEKILPTVKSRCEVERFNLASRTEMRKLELGTEKEKIIFWSFGRPGLALELFQDGQKLEDRVALGKELVRIMKGNLTEKFDLAEKLGKDPVELEEILAVWTALLRQRLFSESLFSFVSKRKALRNLELLEKSAAVLRETNSNPRLVLENLFLNL